MKDWRKRLLGVAKSAGRIYLMLMLAALLGQRYLIYPAPRESVRPVSKGGRHITTRLSDGKQGYAFFTPAQHGNPTLVVFHGNGEQVADGVWLAETMAISGIGSLLVEYPGYGLLAKQSSTETALYDAAEVAIRHLERELSVPREQQVLLGQSLGTGVAVEMAARGHGQRLILLSAYTSMVDLARKRAPLMPVRWLLFDQYDSISKAPRIRCDTLLIHGSLDQIVPLEMGKKLSSQIRGANLWILAGASHNDLWDRGDTDLVARIIDFARGNGRTATQATQ